MSSLWEEVREAEQGINDGEPWALDKFIHSAGTMVETFRLAKSNFTKNRVCAIATASPDVAGHHARAEEPEVRFQGGRRLATHGNARPPGACFRMYVLPCCSLSADSQSRTKPL